MEERKKCRICGIRYDKTKYPLYRVQSSSLTSKLNKISQNNTIVEGDLVCKTCRTKAHVEISQNNPTQTASGGNIFLFV